jgi:hypothetical protein
MDIQMISSTQQYFKRLGACCAVGAGRHETPLNRVIRACSAVVVIGTLVWAGFDRAVRPVSVATGRQPFGPSMQEVMHLSDAEFTQLCLVDGTDLDVMRQWRSTLRSRLEHTTH